VFTNKACLADAKNRLSIKLSWDNFGLFVKEGSIVPTFAFGDNSIRSTEELMDGKCLYDLNIYLDEAGKAEGFLYIDDGKTLDYQHEVRLLRLKKYRKSTLLLL
jgi:alpha-glucosidase (family GH31 glycosyl hydrolase)